MADVWRAVITELREALTEDRCDVEARRNPWNLCRCSCSELNSTYSLESDIQVSAQLGGR